MERAAEYWRTQIVNHAAFTGDVESAFVLMVNTRRRVIGHTLISTGTLDTLFATPREVFRAAIIANAAAIVLMHNHPSGDPAPSEADIRITRDIMRGGQLLKVELLDHVIIGGGQTYRSLRELDVAEKGFAEL